MHKQLFLLFLLLITAFSFAKDKNPNLAWSVTLCDSANGMKAQDFFRRNATEEVHLKMGMIVGGCQKYENGPYKAVILEKHGEYILVKIPSENNVIGWTYEFNLF